MRSREGFFKTVKFTPITILLLTITVLILGCGGSGTTNGDSNNDDNNDTTIGDLASGDTVTGLPGDGSTTIEGCSVFHPFLIDIAGDSKPDLLVGTYDSVNDTYETHFFENTSDGTTVSFSKTDLTGLPSISQSEATTQGVLFTSAGTVNNDSDIDIIATNNDKTATYETIVKYYENDGSNNFAVPVTATLGGFFTATTLADLDNDGDPDRIHGIVLKDDTPCAVRWYTNNNDASGTFPLSPGTLVSSSNISTSTANDIPVPAFVNMNEGEDNDLDMYVTFYKSGTILYYENTGDENTPTFSAATDPLALNPPVGESWFLSFGDVDGDGDVDAIIGTNNGYMHFSENTTIP